MWDDRVMAILDEYEPSEGHAVEVEWEVGGVDDHAVGYMIEHVITLFSKSLYEIDVA